MNQTPDRPTALYIESESVRTALEAMQGRKPFPPDHPLVYMLCMRLESTGGITGTTATETIIYTKLAALIQRRLNRLRTYFGLSPVSRNVNLETVKANIREDFQTDSTELKAASLLYHRYVRIELDLSLENLEQLTGEVHRNLQRRQSRGIARLTQALIRWEYHLRRKHLQAVHRTRLPFPVAPRLIGRDDLLAQAIARLSGTNQPLHLLLYGAAGIGKSILALATAHGLIERQPLSNVVWIDIPDTDINQLLNDIYTGLGLPIPSSDKLFSALLQNDALIVLDNAQPLIEDAAAATEILRHLGTARVILCAKQHNTSLNIHHLHVPELDKESSIKLIEQFVSRLNTHRPDNIEYFDKLYNELGGNPGVLRTALGIRQYYTAPLIATPIYAEYWGQVTQQSRLLWLVLTFSPDGQLPLDTLQCTLDDKKLDELDYAIAELENLNILTITHLPTSRVCLHALGRAYGELILREGIDIELIADAVHYILRNLGTEPDLYRSVCIVNAVPTVGLPPALALDMVYSLQPVIHRGGAWSAWARCLDFLQTLTQGRDRLWIMMQSGIARRWLAQWKVAKYTFGEVIERAGQEGAFEIQHDALLEMALIHRHERHFDSALMLAHQALDYFERHNNRHGIFHALAEEIRIYLAQESKLSEAQAAFERLEKLHSEQPYDEAQFLNLHAQMAFATSALDEAIYYAHRAQHEQAGDLPRAGRTAALLGQIYHALGNRRAAIDHLSGAMTLMQQTEDRLGYARARMNLAAVYIGQGNFRTALTYLHGLPDQFEQLGDMESLQTTKANLDMLNKSIHRWKRQA